MKKWKWATRPMLRGISRILACSDFDAQRFRELGFPDTTISVTGNIKLDITLPPLPESQRTLLLEQLGFGRDPILLGSSTWPGEEAALIQTLRRLRAAGLPCRLLLVPRHAERRREIEDLLRGSGFTYHFRTRGSAPGSVDIYVADTTGELRRLTHLADVVFVGKSLPPHDQGQTPVEAAALGKPLMFGPGMSNFRIIAEELLKRGAARRVASASELEETALMLFRDPPQQTALAEAARSWHRANQGAVARTLNVLETELGKLPVPEISPPAPAKS